MTLFRGLDYLFTRLWPFVLIAFVLGAIVGWVSCPARAISEDEMEDLTP